MSDQQPPPPPPPGWTPPPQPQQPYQQPTPPPPPYQQPQQFQQQYPQQPYPPQQYPQQQYPQYPMPGPPHPRAFAVPMGPGGGSVGLAVGLGLVAAALGAAAWTILVALTKTQFLYAAIALGWVVAQGVLTGSNRRPRVPLMVVAGAITLLACIVSEYYVAYAVSDGILPAFPSPEDFVDIVRLGLRADPITYLFWAAAVAASVFVTNSNQTSVLRR